MGKPAARLGDMHTCPIHGGGPVLPPCLPQVLIGGEPAARKGDKAECFGPPDEIAMGSPSVLIGGAMAARLGDPTVHGGKVSQGDFSVLIGDAPGSGDDSSSDDDSSQDDSLSDDSSSDDSTDSTDDSDDSEDDGAESSDDSADSNSSDSSSSDSSDTSGQDSQELGGDVAVAQSLDDMPPDNALSGEVATDAASAQGDPLASSDLGGEVANAQALDSTSSAPLTGEVSDDGNSAPLQGSVATDGGPGDAPLDGSGSAPLQGGVSTNGGTTPGDAPPGGSGPAPLQGSVSKQNTPGAQNPGVSPGGTFLTGGVSKNGGAPLQGSAQNDPGDSFKDPLVFKAMVPKLDSGPAKPFQLRAAKTEGAGGAQKKAGGARNRPRQFRGIIVTGTNDFRRQVFQILNRLNRTRTGRTILHDIATSGRHVTITAMVGQNGFNQPAGANANRRPDGTPGPGTNSTIQFNPQFQPIRVERIPEAPVRIPNTVVLLHELIHADHVLHGTRETGQTHGVNNEELRTMGVAPFNIWDRTENGLRRELHLPQRFNH